MARAPIADGFRAVFRGPGLLLAEICWRWCFGMAAWVLIALTFREWLAGIRLSSADWLLARTGQPVLLAGAIADALQGAAGHLIRASIVVVLGLVVFWVFAASVGRAATLKALLPGQQKTGFSSLVGLHFLRAALALAGLIGFLGVIIVSERAVPVDLGDSSAVMARVLVFLLLAVLVGFLWSVVNWFLSLAPIFVLRDGRDTFGAVADSWAFFRRRSATLLGVTFVFDVVRVVLLITAALIAAGPIAGVQRSSEFLAALWFALAVALIYFALADLLYVARLAAYVNIAEQEPEAKPRAVTDQPVVPLLTPDP